MISTFWTTMARDRWVWAGLVCVALVSIPLALIMPGSDWLNHVWMVDYQARFFANHGWFASQWNTDQIAGMNFPVFYGYLFFPLIGMCSTLLSANMTLRIMAVGLLLLQFILIYKASAQWTGNRFFAFTLGTLAVWSIYPLTNLYNRGAIPEFFACGLLTCACVALVQALRTESRRNLWMWCNFSVLCLCTCAGTHPITALFGVPFYALLFGMGVVGQRRRALPVLLALLLPSVIATICLAPWVVATARYNKSLDIASTFREVSYYPKSIDGLLLKICPIPVPYQHLRHKAVDEHMGTPGLDAQINMPMLVLCLFVLVALIRQKRLRPTLIVCSAVLLGLAAWLTYLSSVQYSLDKLGYYVRAIQFAYRLVTYINLSIFAALILAVSQSSRTIASAAADSLSNAPNLLPPIDEASSESASASSLSTAVPREQSLHADGSRAGTASSLKEMAAPTPKARGAAWPDRTALVAPAVLVPLLLIGVVAISFKLFEMQALDPFNFKIYAGQLSDNELLQLPFNFYGHQNYLLTGFMQFAPDTNGDHLPAIKLLPGRGREFGRVQPAKVMNAQHGWVVTNVQPFPWNGLVVNDAPLSQKTALACRTVTVLPTRPLDQARSIGIEDLPAGTLQYRFNPDPDWAALNQIALPIFLLWLGGTAIFSLIAGFTPCKNCVAAPAVATN